MPNIKSAKKRVIVTTREQTTTSQETPLSRQLSKRLMPLLSQMLPTKKFLLKLQLRKSTRLLQRVLFI